MEEEAFASEVDESKFRLQNQRILLTYSGHLDKLEYVAWITSKIKYKPVFIRLAHETGDNGDYLHTHVLIDFGKSFQTRSCRYFDYQGDIEVLHPHIKTIKTKIHFENAMVYLSKEDPENADLKKSSQSSRRSRVVVVNKMPSKSTQNPPGMLKVY